MQNIIEIKKLATNKIILLFKIIIDRKKSDISIKKV